MKLFRTRATGHVRVPLPSPLGYSRSPYSRRCGRSVLALVHRERRQLRLQTGNRRPWQRRLLRRSVLHSHDQRRCRHRGPRRHRIVDVDRRRCDPPGLRRLPGRLVQAGESPGQPPDRLQLCRGTGAEPAVDHRRQRRRQDARSRRLQLHLGHLDQRSHRADARRGRRLEVGLHLPGRQQRRPDRRSDVIDHVHERRTAVQRLLEGQFRIPEEH
jgi:hypothetical protein